MWDIIVQLPVGIYQFTKIVMNIVEMFGFWEEEILIPVVEYEACYDNWIMQTETDDSNENTFPFLLCLAYLL